MTSFLTSNLSRQPKMSVNSKFVVISLFLNELSSNLVEEIKIGSLFIFIAKKTNFLNYLSQAKNFDSDFGNFIE